MGDAIKWLLDIIAAIKDFFTKSPNERLAGIADMLNGSIREFVEAALSDGYRRLQGAFVGLSDNVAGVLVAVVILIAVATTFGDSAKWYKRLFHAIIAYALLFLAYRFVLDWSLQLSDAARGIVYTLARLEPSGLATAITSAIGGISLLGGFEYFIATSALAFSAPVLKFELELFKYIALALLLVYPLLLLFSPFGKGARSWLHTANASFVTIVLAPPIMAFTMLGPHFLSLLGFGGTGTAQAIAMIVCICLAACVPFIVWSKAKTTSVKIAGKVTAVINGEVSTKHTGDVTATVKQEPGAVKSFVTTMAFGTAGLTVAGGGEPGSFSEGMKRVAADASAAALTAVGHPEMAAVVQGLDAARRKKVEQNKQANQKPPYQPPTPGPLPNPKPKP